MMQNDLKRIRLAVSGRVQGVGFRWFVMRVARDANLQGWVKNNPDGSVELEAAGPSAAIDHLRDRVGTGPRISRVDQVRDLTPSDQPLPFPFAVAE